MELPQAGWRRHHPRHAVPLALRARQPVWGSQSAVLPRRDAHSASLGRERQEVPDENYDNAFKAQWELFLRHVAGEGPFRWGLLEGAKGVQLAELGYKTWRQKKWLDVPKLKA